MGSNPTPTAIIEKVVELTEFVHIFAGMNHIHDLSKKPDSPKKYTILDHIYNGIRSARMYTKKVWVYYTYVIPGFGGEKITWLQYNIDWLKSFWNGASYTPESSRVKLPKQPRTFGTTQYNSPSSSLAATESSLVKQELKVLSKLKAIAENEANTPKTSDDPVFKLPGVEKDFIARKAE